MSSEENTWKQFPDEIGQWDEAPSPAAWDSLESMLDNQPPAGKVVKFNPGPIIGVIALLIAIGLTWFLLPKDAPISSQTFAEVTHQDPSEQSPVLTSPIDTSRPIPPVAAVEPLQPISVQPIERRNPDIDFSAVVSRSMVPHIDLNARGPVYDPADPSSYPVTREDSLEYYQHVDFPNIQAPQQQVSRAFNSIYSNGNWNENTAPLLQNFSNDLSYTSRQSWNPATTSTISDLNWLLGSWKHSGPSGGGFEEWKMVDRYTLTGKGFFVVNGDTVVTERMQIREMPDGLYYIVAIDTARQPHKYRLLHTGPGKAVFQNENEDAPNDQIEFEQSDNKHLQIRRMQQQGRNQQEEVQNYKRHSKNP